MLANSGNSEVSRNREAEENGNKNSAKDQSREVTKDTTKEANKEVSKEVTKEVTKERRTRNIPVAVDRRRAASAAEKRRTSERRRLIDPTTCERDYTQDETDFMKAMDRYKRENRRPYPTLSEVLEVLHSLGYRKVEKPGAMPTGAGINRGAASGIPPKG